MKLTMKKRIISMLVTIAIVLSLVPMTSAEADPCEFCTSLHCIPEPCVCHNRELHCRVSLHDFFGVFDVTENGFRNGHLRISDVIVVLQAVQGVLSSKIIRAGVGSPEWNAALITGGDEPTIWDAIEVYLAWARSPKSVLLGYPLPLIIDENLLTFSVDRKNNIIKYYTAKTLEVNERYNFEFITDSEMASLEQFNILVDFRRNHMTQNFDAPFNQEENNHIIHAGTIIPYSDVPANTLVATQEFCSDNNPNEDFFVHAPSLSIRKGYVLGNDEVSILDAVAVLQGFARVPGSPVMECVYAREASLITPKAQADGYPTILDAVEVLKYYAKVPGNLIEKSQMQG